MSLPDFLLISGHVISIAAWFALQSACSAFRGHTPRLRLIHHQPGRLRVCGCQEAQMCFNPAFLLEVWVLCG